MQYIENESSLMSKELWNCFDKVLGIPHPSGKEEKLTEFIKGFGEGLGLETTIDAIGNVLIRKPASKGKERNKTIVLQSHLDMVPQQNSGRNHNFETDPIQAYVDEGVVKAKGTTLGVDNGIGVAATMAILQSKAIKHGPIEALFTVDEERGMTGVINLEKGILKGNVLLNFDGDNDEEITIGSAGGVDSIVEFFYQEELCCREDLAFEVSITGLKGGHSGVDIHLGRGNANKLMNRVLYNAAKCCLFRISSIKGGSVRNAIPRESKAIIVIKKNESDIFLQNIENAVNEIKTVLSSADFKFKVQVIPISLPTTIVPLGLQNKVLSTICAAPNGVIKFSFIISGLVETSTNLAQVIIECGKVSIFFKTRSSVEAEKVEVCNMISSIFEQAGAKVIHDNYYPGWNPDEKSEIVGIAEKIYTKLFNKSPKVNAIHAGLECGFLKSAYPELDMLSLGPTIIGAHSPDECVSVASVEKFWKLIVSIIEECP